MGIPYAEVIGDPIAHSRSPLIHGLWLGQSGMERAYRATRVTPDTLPDYLAERRADPDWRGCNLTMPLKVRAVDYLDEANESVLQLGATNCILPRGGGLSGMNFDSAALLRLLAPTVWSGRAVIVGSGGAARAALQALMALGFDRITIMARDPERAAPLVERDGETIDFVPLGGAPECRLLVNATPLGMAGFPPLPVSLASMPPGSAVFEMVYEPLVTPMVAEARSRGFAIFDGLAMLIEQAAMSFASFYGQGIDLEQRDDARAMLTR